jgi:hypothetical protein
MSKIGNILIGMTFGSMAIGLTSCKKEYTPRYPKVENMLSGYGVDGKKLSSSWRQDALGVADAQASLDSVAFRTLFNSTEAVKDSAKVAEFNKIAVNNRIPEYISSQKGADMYFSRKLREKVNSLDDMKKIQSYIGAYYSTSETGAELSKKQYISDSINYTRFFERHKLLNDSTLKEGLKITTQKIRP